MSENKKYYYLKLKENYFERDNVKILESMENGHTYSLIILKLYLKSLRTDGRLMMTDRIPYDPSKLSILAKVINHDKDHVKEAVKIAKELDIIEVLNTGEMFMAEIQNFIGLTSTEADRIREYRKKINPLQIENKSVQMYDKSTPEIEIKIEIEKELKIKKDIKKKEAFTIPTVQEIQEYCKERNNKVNAEKFFNYYESKGWMVGKTKMTKWKAAVRTWEQNNFEKQDDRPPVRQVKDGEY